MNKTLKCSAQYSKGIIFAMVLSCFVGNALADQTSRIKELKSVINRHTGFAHFTRGMNQDTIKALRKAVTAQDIPVLEIMLFDADRVSAMTSANVLQGMGDAGIAALLRAQQTKKLNTSLSVDIDEMLRQYQTEQIARLPLASRNEIAAIDQEIRNLQVHSKNILSGFPAQSAIDYLNPGLEIRRIDAPSPDDLKRLKMTAEFQKIIEKRIAEGAHMQLIAHFNARNLQAFPVSEVTINVQVKSRRSGQVWLSREFQQMFSKVIDAPSNFPVPNTPLKQQVYHALKQNEQQAMRIFLAEFTQEEWQKMPQNVSDYQLSLTTLTLKANENSLLDIDARAIDALQKRKKLLMMQK